MKIIKNFKSLAFFETRRLLAYQLSASDLNKFELMHTNLTVMSTLGGVRSAQKTLENMEWNLKQWQTNGFGLWMFYLKSTNEWIGRGGLRRLLVNGAEEVEVGYALMPSFWNCGYATEITQACIEIAFDVLHLENIVSFTLLTNQASQRVMQKAGFTYEKNIIIPYEGVNYPHVLYRIKNARKNDGKCS